MWSSLCCDLVLTDVGYAAVGVVVAAVAGAGGVEDSPVGSGQSMKEGLFADQLWTTRTPPAVCLLRLDVHPPPFVTCKPIRLQVQNMPSVTRPPFRPLSYSCRCCFCCCPPLTRLCDFPFLLNRELL